VLRTLLVLFFTVEATRLRTLYVLSFIELGTRRVHMAGATTNPDSPWVTRQARSLAIEGRLHDVGFLIRDRNTKFSGPFGEVFRTEGVRVINTPDPGPQRQRLRRAMGRDRPLRVPRLGPPEPEDLYDLP
jgi:hypothetical protein